MPDLERAGFHIDVSPLLATGYVEGLYHGKRWSVLKIACAIAARVMRLLCIGTSVDLLWIEKELLPWLPACLESLVRLHRIPCVVDYDDAVFHNYDMHRSPVVRRLLGRKIDMVMRNAELVVAGNSYLADRALHAGAKRVAVLPTVIDSNRYPQASPTMHEGFVIGWIGSPSTESYLVAVAPVLKEFCSRYNARVVAIGSSPGLELPGVPTTVKAWSGETEVRYLRGCDVGIMPLPDDAWARGKCGLKLIQYMACGLPVVASPVGANKEIVLHGESGFLAETPEDWVVALERLHSDPTLAARMGAVGRKLAHRYFSKQVVAPRLARILEEVAGCRKHGREVAE